MKINIIPVLALMLVFGGIVVPVTETRAQDAIDMFDIDLNDNRCSYTEKALSLCIEILNGNSTIDYVVHVYPNEFNYGDSNADPPTPPTWVWPIRNEGTVTFQYRGSVYEDEDGISANCSKVPAWNYFVQLQSSCVAEDLLWSNPPGAQLLLPGGTVPKCTDTAADEGQNLLKLNPQLNCSEGNDVVFSFTYTNDVSMGRCNISKVVTKLGCEGGNLLGPDCGGLPFQASQSHTFDPGQSIAVEYEPGPCGEGVQVKSVAIDGSTEGVKKNKAWICTPAPAGSALGEPYIVDVPDFGLMICIKPKKAGLQNQGAVIDANPRTYLFGGDAYTR